MNILNKASEIIYERSEEKDRQYGPIEESMHMAANIASFMAGHVITADDMYICMIALKLSRESYSHKEDNLLDAVAYIASWNDLRNSENNENI